MNDLQKQLGWIKKYAEKLDLRQPLSESTFLKCVPHGVALEIERRYGFFSCNAVSREEENMYWQELKASMTLSSCFSAASYVIKHKALKQSASCFMSTPIDTVLKLKTFNDFKKYFESQSYAQIIMALIHITGKFHEFLTNQLLTSDYDLEVENYITHLCEGYERMDSFLNQLTTSLILHLAPDLLEHFLIEETSKTHSCCFFGFFKSKKSLTLEDFVKFCDALNTQSTMNNSDESTPLLLVIEI